MACHNAEDYVQQAIDSVVKQTFSSWELIIFDDASQDDSLLIIKSSSLSDPRIRYISSVINVGASAARNAAIEASKGEWLAILDADDVYLPHKLEKQYKVIENSGSSLVLVGAGCFHINHKGERINEFKYSANSKVLKKNLHAQGKFPPHSSLVYRKSSFMAAGKFNVRFERSEDYELWLRLSEFGDFAVSQLSLIEYRLHFTNISNSKCSQKLTQLEYSVAAAVCQRIKCACLADPRAFNDDRHWREFLNFVATFIERSGYRNYIEWKNDIKKNIKNESNFICVLKICLLAAYNSPLGVIRLVEERTVGNRLSNKVLNSWRKSKRQYE